jgi:hypothetical protein
MILNYICKDKIIKRRQKIRSDIIRVKGEV